MRQKEQSEKGERVEVSGRCERLDGLFHKTGTKAARTDADALGSSIDQRPNRLEIRTKDPLRFVIGMTHIMSGLMPLCANLTYIGHGLHSSSSDSAIH